jgi:hypothetical protein
VAATKLDVERDPFVRHREIRPESFAGASETKPGAPPAGSPAECISEPLRRRSRAEADDDCAGPGCSGTRHLRRREMKEMPTHVVIERIHECMRPGLGAHRVKYDEELARLVNEFGVDFVSHHACEETWSGGEECPPGHCERPDGHGVFGPDAEREYTCRQACRDYVEFLVGHASTN